MRCRADRLHVRLQTSVDYSSKCTSTVKVQTSTPWSESQRRFAHGDFISSIEAALNNSSLLDVGLEAPVRIALYTLLFTWHWVTIHRMQFTVKVKPISADLGVAYSWNVEHNWLRLLHLYSESILSMCGGQLLPKVIISCSTSLSSNSVGLCDFTGITGSYFPRKYHAIALLFGTFSGTLTLYTLLFLVCALKQ